MRKVILDTDTASDDAIAIMMLLRAKDIQVEAITVVAGNVPLDIAITNALISVEQADTYIPPVYAGADKPLVKELETGQFAHGMNGMGDIDLPVPKIEATDGFAPDKILECIQQATEPIDLIAIGPLTNIALAIQKDKATMEKLHKLYLMGGNGLGGGNITEYAEYNFYVDAEAVEILYDTNIEIVALPWNTCINDLYMYDAEVEEIKSNNNERSVFAMEINKGLDAFNQKYFNKSGFCLADPGIIAAYVDESIVEKGTMLSSKIETKDPLKYGTQIVSQSSLGNIVNIDKINSSKFIKIMKKLLN